MEHNDPDFGLLQGSTLHDHGSIAMWINFRITNKYVLTARNWFWFMSSHMLIAQFTDDYDQVILAKPLLR
jgi:hypothetical protein